MAWKKVYDWERQTWPEFYAIPLARENAGKFIRKLVRHFKTPPVEVAGGTRKGHGLYLGTGAYYYSAVIKLPSNGCDLSLVCHEFAHHLANTRWRENCHHNKKFKHELKRIYTFAKRWFPSPDWTLRIQRQMVADQIRRILNLEIRLGTGWLKAKAEGLLRITNKPGAEK